MRMCEAAEKFWNDEGIIPDERSTHPLQESVVAWFMKCGFKKAPAQAAAKLITPDWVRLFWCCSPALSWMSMDEVGPNQTTSH